MDEMKSLRRENARLKMQIDMLKQKLYQVCVSHDHMSVALNRANIPMSFTDRVMMETTKRIMVAKTPEEIETIYSDSTAKLFTNGLTKKNTNSSSSLPWFKKVYFFPQKQDAGESLIDAINKMIADINEQIGNLSDEDKKLYETGMADDGLDDFDLPEDPLDSNDDLKPPF
jgi:hypothetical protein